MKYKNLGLFIDGCMESRVRNFVSATCFCSILGLMISLLNNFFIPKGVFWNTNENKIAFYQEPENTIEVLFLGSSSFESAIIPIQIYEDYGICAYNISAPSQPIGSCYYWLEEVYRLHAASLRYVFVDVSMLRQEQHIGSFQTTIDSLKNNQLKKDAIYRIAKERSDFINRSSPLFQYHERWTEIDNKYYETDLEIPFLRGYYPFTAQAIDIDLNTPDYYPGSIEGGMLDPEGVMYLRKVISFCNDHDLEIILVKLPALINWDSEKYNNVNEIAQEYGIKYVDFCFVPYIDEIYFIYPMDMFDNSHLNYYGAKKITDWFGEYISNDGKLTRSENEHLEQQMNAFSFKKAQLELEMMTDVSDYISYASQIPNTYVFLSVMDDASYSLSNEQRKAFANLGLWRLSQLSFQEPYVAVLSEGKVIYEYSGNTDNNGTSQEINCDGIMPNEKNYYLSSYGGNNGVGTISIDEKESMTLSRGINVVIYSYESSDVLMKATFDTYANQEKIGMSEFEYSRMLDSAKQTAPISSSQRKVISYLRECEGKRTEMLWETHYDHNMLFEYLELWRNKSDYYIVLSVLDEATNKFTQHTRDGFYKLGLKNMATLGYRDSYIGIIDNGNVIYDFKDHGIQPIEYDDYFVRAISGGGESGNICCILFNGQEYAEKKRGINIAVYDKRSQKVVSHISFDTYENPIVIGEDQN